MDEFSCCLCVCLRGNGKLVPRLEGISCDSSAPLRFSRHFFMLIRFSPWQLKKLLPQQKESD